MCVNLAAGIEPATSRLEALRAIRLRHANEEKDQKKQKFCFFWGGFNQIRKK
eukprot:COSAG01_NODE_22108_length_871_cov_1.468912_2_plen_51_part_01